MKYWLGVVSPTREMKEEIKDVAGLDLHRRVALDTDYGNIW
jgi:hypothetical protein